ncbi:MAG: peptide-methionine (R)-S-oxide reductase [Pseudoruegeria sp.]|uniref:peptide-methionine (R)-S-oxide reductase n=1 Tax=Ascidiaceihabitans sp. TaxID=1872644 RepID=UPI00329A7E6E
MIANKMNRRSFLSTSAVGLGATAIAAPAHARYVSSEDGFDYEVTKSPEAWLEQLGEHDFNILRKGATETPKSSPYWDQTGEGSYSCKGCDLPVYDARWKRVLDKGWVFFQHAEPNSTLSGIDWPEGSNMAKELEILTAMEVHCRRCGGHLGHVFYVENQMLHCINGSSLNFTAAQA